MLDLPSPFGRGAGGEGLFSENPVKVKPQYFWKKKEKTGRGQ